MTNPKLVAAWIPGLPHVLSPDRNSGYRALHDAATKVGVQFQAAGVKRVLYYSTQWLSVLGHSVQSRAVSKGLHVDENWYQFGALPYHFKTDASLANSLLSSVAAQGYQVRSVDYEGFPIDTGTIVADTLINKTKKLLTL